MPSQNRFWSLWLRLPHPVSFDVCAMNYFILTGGTGLLGSYLLRNAMCAGLPVAVIVRPSRRESARQRVESLLARLEREQHVLLPRPVVLEGDLHKPALGLSEQELDWVARNGRALIHNAASLTFYGKDRSGEPWRSNVEGTRHTLELCHRAGLCEYHYVSTAYVCGSRKGLIRETELDCKQQPNNDYEQSKIEAERMVREAAHLKTSTVYRPSIIVGDSQTGYTPTFHGFYAPLRLAHTLSSRVRRRTTSGVALMLALGATGNETKNFVPVDWVADVMLHVLFHPEWHGRTYHLTSPQPVAAREMVQVMDDAVELFSSPAGPEETDIRNETWFAAEFREQMNYYKSYWDDDPKFDRTNTEQAAGHLPCPKLDYEVLMQLARFAFQANFGRPQPKPVIPGVDFHQHLRPTFDRSRLTSCSTPTPRLLGLQIDGPGGGQWTLRVFDNTVRSIEPGLPPEDSSTLRVPTTVLHPLLNARLTPSQAAQHEAVRFRAGKLSKDDLRRILEVVLTSVSRAGYAAPSPEAMLDAASRSSQSAFRR